MSYTEHQAIASLQVAQPFSSLDEVVHQHLLPIFAVSLEGVLPELSDFDSDEWHEAITEYLEWDPRNNWITVTLNTADGNSNSSTDVYEWLLQALAPLSVKPWFTSTWASFDSTNGPSGSTEYLRRDGSVIDVTAAIDQYLAAEKAKG